MRGKHLTVAALAVFVAAAVALIPSATADPVPPYAGMAYDAAHDAGPMEFNNCVAHYDLLMHDVPVGSAVWVDLRHSAATDWPDWDAHFVGFTNDQVFENIVVGGFAPGTLEVRAYIDFGDGQGIWTSAPQILTTEYDDSSGCGH